MQFALLLHPRQWGAVGCLSTLLFASGCSFVVGANNDNSPEASAPDTPSPDSPAPDTPSPDSPAPDTPSPSVSPEGEPAASPEGEPAASPDAPSPEAEPPCVDDDDFFAEEVQPVLNSCVGCHVADGIAGHTAMVLDDAGDADATAANQATLQALALRSNVQTPLFVLKPTLVLPHTGGQLFSSTSPEALALTEMAHRFRSPGACDDPGPLRCEELTSDTQPPARRLSNEELVRTLQDVFPNVWIDEEGLSFLAEASRNLFDNQAASTSPTSLGTRYERTNAQLLAQRLASQLGNVSPCEASDAACPRTFVQTIGRRLFRRPLSAAEEDLYASFFESGPTSDDFTLSAEMSLQAMLMSPAFLYRLELGVDDTATTTTLTAYETATRLAFFIWGTTPDDDLLDAAATGALSTQEGLEAEVDRMLADDKATDGIMHLLRYWLDTTAVQRTNKPDDLGFDYTRKNALEEEGERFLRDIVLGESPTLTTLLTSNETFNHASFSDLYNLPAPSTEWERVTHTEPRYGILTLAGFLASRGHAEQPSPIKRAKYVLERLMCYDIGSPPPEAEGAEVEMTDVATNRQATDALTLQGSCRGCHQVVNPMGFPFENYDTTGAIRTVDNGLPVDTSGEFAQTSFTGVGDMADFLVDSPFVHRCIAQRFTQYALGHDVAGGECLIDDVTAAFADDGYNLHTLVRSIAVHPAFAYGTLDKSFDGGQQ